MPARLTLIGAVIALPALSVFGQSDSGAPRFEVADVHASGPAMNPFTFASGGVLRGERYDLRKATMLDLIRTAYKVAPETIVGGPNWLEFDRFDIAAKAPARTSPENIRRMLQALLVERFHLTVHNDMRPMPAYVLSAGKTKPSMTQSTEPGEPDCRYVPPPDESVALAFSCHNMTMSALATRLRGSGGDYIKEPVIDATGIEGAWDFDIHWNRRAALLPAGTERVTVMDAVEKQLGLKLDLREAPAPVLVIDHVDRPTPNVADVAQKLPARPLAFDVATLKLNKTDHRGYPRYTRAGIQGAGLPLVPMLGFAWDVSTVHTRQKFIGLPKGVDSVYFDIDARTEERTNELATGDNGYDDDLRAMARALFVERFRIKWHYEDRPMDAYSLAAAKPKLKKADTSVRASCHEVRSIANDPRDANPLLTQLISCRNVTLAQFASKLLQIDDFTFTYPVEDATGIKGTFDFDLSFTPGEMFERNAGRTAGDSAGPIGVVSLAEAISKLGLRLEKRKRMLPAIVIDHMDLTPAEN